MNKRTIFITHVELLNNFVKIYGQLNRGMAIQIEFGLSTTYNLFTTHPTPLLSMLDGDSIILVTYNGKYYRGKFVSAATDKLVNVLLIDMGNVVMIDLKSVS